MSDVDEPTTELIRGIFGDARELAVAHVESVKLELRDELERVGRASLRTALAIASFSVAAAMVGLALAHALSTYTALPVWAAYLVSAGILAAVGGAFVGTITPKGETSWLPRSRPQISPAR